MAKSCSEDGAWLLHHTISVQAPPARLALLYVGSNPVADFQIEDSLSPSDFDWSKWEPSERDEYGRFNFRHKLRFRALGGKGD